MDQSQDMSLVVLIRMAKAELRLLVLMKTLVSELFASW